MFKKLVMAGLFAALVIVGFTGCANHFEGEYGTIPGKSGKYYTFDNLTQLENSLLYIENKEYGQLTAGLKKDFRKEKSTKLTYESETDSSGLNYAEIGKPVVAFENAIFHAQSTTSYGMGYSMSRGYYTGGIRIYVWSDVEARWSDPWDFDFGCDTK